MPVLHNRVSNEMLRARMLAETEPRTTISFYKYFTIDDPQATRDALYQAFTALNVFGRVYLAREGINAQISVPESKVSAFRECLYRFDPALDGLRLNIALDDDGKSFWVLRMKVRERIVADGIDDPEFNPADVGEYLKADAEVAAAGLQVISNHTKAIISFALCGFANLSSIAILIGGLGSMAPNRRQEIAQLGLKAVAAGTLSNLMSATIAGLFLAL